MFSVYKDPVGEVATKNCKEKPVATAMATGAYNTASHAFAKKVHSSIQHPSASVVVAQRKCAKGETR